MPNTENGQKGEELAKFFKQCKDHDWFYAMSDDQRVFQIGSAQRAKLLNAIEVNEEKWRIYEAWRAYIFEGKRKPEVSDFVATSSRHAELLDFYRRCENHQWFYAVLEGQEYYTAQEERNALVAEADKDQGKQAIFLLWKKHMFEEGSPKPDPPQPVIINP